MSAIPDPGRASNLVALLSQPPLFAMSMAERFEEFHEANPYVYVALVTLAREWVARTGRRHLGIKTLFERARWEIALTTTDPDFRLNNNYTAFYSRLIMRQEPDLADMFALRRSAADEMLERTA